jgi:hypothetical protein
MGFMRKAPRKEKGGLSRLGLYEIWQARNRLNLLPAQTKIEISGWHPKGLLLVPICRVSPNSSATVVAVRARGGEPQWHRKETAPRPGAIR